MGCYAVKLEISRSIGKFVFDRRAIALLVFASIFVAAHAWLRAHPENNPWAPLDLRDPPGWATQSKLTAIGSDTEACRAVLERSEVQFEVLASQGSGACARPDRTILSESLLQPGNPAMTCPAAIGLHLWLEKSLQPAAMQKFGQEIVSIQHLGVHNCRRLYGRSDGAWSEHATGNAVDIAGFTLSDGTTISVLSDWDDGGAKGEFLSRVRDDACAMFGTVLSPDYNAAHRDHFHLDQAERAWGVCR